MQLQAPQRCHKPPDATNLEATPEKGALFLGHLGCLGCLGIWAALKLMPTRKNFFHFFNLGIIFRAAQMPRQPR